MQPIATYELTAGDVTVTLEFKYSDAGIFVSGVAGTVKLEDVFVPDLAVMYNAVDTAIRDLKKKVDEQWQPPTETT